MDAVPIQPAAADGDSPRSDGADVRGSVVCGDFRRDQSGPAYHNHGDVGKGGAHSHAFFGVAQSAFFHDRLRPLVGGREISNHRPTTIAMASTRISSPAGSCPALARSRVTPALNLYGSVGLRLQNYDTAEGSA